MDPKLLDAQLPLETTQVGTKDWGLRNSWTLGHAELGMEWG